MNTRLALQVRKHLPDLDTSVEPWRSFLASVSESYDTTDSAETADRAKNEFLAVVSHEMRTPLNAILGFAQLLRDASLTVEQQAWIQTIIENGESLGTIIDDILDYSRIEAGSLELSEEPVVLRELLDSVVSMFRPRISEKGLDIKLQIESGVPPAVRTDGNRLRQVLVNVINNAVKFTHEGGITLRAGVEHRDEDGLSCTLRFEVQDTGIGIRPEHRDRLFRAFSQADSSTTRTYGGTGLGLAICRRLCRALGGEIDFTSEPGTGSLFFFTIRARTASQRSLRTRVSPRTVSIPS